MKVSIVAHCARPSKMAEIGDGPMWIYKFSRAKSIKENHYV